MISEANKKLLWHQEESLQHIEKIAGQLLPHLAQKAPFALLLVGELGAGKTTLTRFILQALGLNSKRPVNSPSYTLVNEYQIQSKHYAHLDLYRLNEEISAAEASSFDFDKDIAGYFIEWPKEQFLSNCLITPTHLLNIDILENARQYSFFSL